MINGELSIDDLVAMWYNSGIIKEKTQMGIKMEFYDVEEILDEERSLKVFKSDSLIQKARYELSITEQRFVLYVLSKIKPNDTPEKLYEINLRDFQFVCGTEDHDSYDYIKAWLKRLSDKSWWLIQGDEEVLVRWFNRIRMRKNSGKVIVRFDEEMFPFAFQLAEQMRATGKTYTSYMFRYILPMRSTYSVRIYELLKSYNKNNTEWTFKFETLKHILNCDNYKFNDFKRNVLEVALKEINKYTDVNVDYSTVLKGRKVVAVTFKIVEKDIADVIDAQKDGLTELEGNIHYWDVKKEK